MHPLQITKENLVLRKYLTSFTFQMSLGLLSRYLLWWYSDNFTCCIKVHLLLGGHCTVYDVFLCVCVCVCVKYLVQKIIYIKSSKTGTTTSKSCCASKDNIKQNRLGDVPLPSDKLLLNPYSRWTERTRQCNERKHENYQRHVANSDWLHSGQGRWLKLHLPADIHLYVKNFTGNILLTILSLFPYTSFHVLFLWSFVPLSLLILV